MQHIVYRLLHHKSAIETPIEVSLPVLWRPGRAGSPAHIAHAIDYPNSELQLYQYRLNTQELDKHIQADYQQQQQQLASLRHRS